MQGLSKGWRLILIVIGLAVLFLLIVDFNGRMSELRRLTAEKERVGAQVTHLVETKTYLETRIAYATSDAAVAEWAYNNKQVRPGEVLVVPLPPAGSTPVPTPTPAVTPQVIHNWQVWLMLFVDENLAAQP